MKIIENIIIGGNVRFELYEAGKTINIAKAKNTQTDNGLKIIAARMSNLSLNAPSHIAIGTASGGKNTASNALQAEIARVAFNVNSFVWASPFAIVTYEALFIAGVGTGLIKETGVFNANAAGLLFAWADFVAFNKTAVQTARGVWTVTYRRP